MEKGKKEKNKLAINGGERVSAGRDLGYDWPVISKSVEKKVLSQLHDNISIYDRSGIFEKFENKFAKYHKKKYAILQSSGTLALHAMYVAAGFKKGDEVICPAYTFFATVTPLLFTGAKPVLCDCDENGNIDPDEVQRKITRRTKGVIVTHMWGIPCQTDKIVSICKKNKLILMEDCSHAHGAEYKGKKIGSFGDMAAWSLQGPKNISGGEGGIVVTNNKDYYYKILLLGHYNKRCKQEISPDHRYYKYATTGMGLKYRAHPLAVVIMDDQFDKLDQTRKTRDKFARKMIKALSSDFLKAPKLDRSIKPSWYALVFQYNKDKFSNVGIEKFVEALHAEGLSEVDIPGSTSPLNLLPLFQRPNDLFPGYNFSYKKGDFPKAENFYSKAIKLPVWAKSSDQKIVNTYIKGFKKVINNQGELI